MRRRDTGGIEQTETGETDTSDTTRSPEQTTEPSAWTGTTIPDGMPYLGDFVFRNDDDVEHQMTLRIEAESGETVIDQTLRIVSYVTEELDNPISGPGRFLVTASLDIGGTAEYEWWLKCHSASEYLVVRMDEDRKVEIRKRRHTSTQHC